MPSPHASSPAADVVVVGAGPVGLVLSLMLASRGWSVTCVERWPEPYPRPRAVAFDDEAARILQGLGLMPEIFAVSNAGGNLYDWRNAADETILLIDNRGIGRSGWHKRVGFTQPELEEILRRHVVAHPLVDFRSGLEVVALEQDPAGATLTVRAFGADPATAPTSEIAARYVVGCDGANSTVRDAMDTEMVDLGFFYDWLILDVIPHEDRVWDPPSLQRCDPRRPATIIPSGPGRRRWEFMVLPGEDIEEMNSSDTAWRLLEPWDLHPGNATLERHTVYRFQARWSTVWNDGRLLLAGDSAHLMPPFAGQGFCSGMRDAANLSWKLDLVLAGSAPQSLLDTYTTERVQHVQHAITFSIELGKVICVLDPDEADARDARMLAHAGDPAAVLPALPPAGFDRGVVATGPDGTALAPAGRLSPQPLVRSAAREALLDDVVGSTFALICFDDLTAHLSAESLLFLTERGCRVVRLVAPSVRSAPDDRAPDDSAPDDIVDLTGGYADELAAVGAAAVLVRPDGYYFGSADSLDQVDALVVALRRSLEGESA